MICGRTFAAVGQQDISAKNTYIGIMATIDSETAKRYGTEAGASVVGIASSDGFGSAPEGYRPSDVLEGCRSVIVLGVPFPEEAFSDPCKYTEVRAELIERTNGLVKEVAKRIKKDGYKAKEITSIGGRYVDGFTRSPISLKHAAECAGLGVIGKNYLLINPEYGTRLWFCAVITDAELVPDKRTEYDICDDCGVCVDSCPCGALNDITSFGKKGCAKHSFRYVNKKWMMDCFKCRSVCPHSFGIR